MILLLSIGLIVVTVVCGLMTITNFNPFSFLLTIISGLGASASIIALFQKHITKKDLNEVVKSVETNISRPIKHKGLEIYHKLWCQGQTNRFFNVYLILGIKNNGQFTAKYYYFSIIVPNDFCPNKYGLDWKPVDKNRRQYDFRGGNDNVIHPQSQLEITRIHFELPKNAQVATDCPTAQISYTIKAEDFETVNGEYLLTPDEILKWKDEMQALGRLVP